MKITDVQTKIYAERFAVVKVYTDEGITGFGEISPQHAQSIKTLIQEAIKPRIMGMDPFNIEKIWEDCFLHYYKLGPRGVHLYGIAAIDIALYDIKGKAMGVPVYELLGGKYREKVPMYASFHRRDCTPLEQAEAAAEMVDRGYEAVKIRLGKPWGFDDHFKWSVEMVKETRAAVGDDIEILVDANCGFTPPVALKLGRILEKYNVWHFEEPIADYELNSMADLASSLDIPIAAGEQRYNRWDFHELIKEGNIDIIQPDIVKSGGFTETKKIAVIADLYGKPITMHCSQPTLGFIANLHFQISTPGCRYYQEHLIEDHPLQEVFFKEAPVVKDGYFIPLNKPGLGVELNEKALKKYETE